MEENKIKRRSHRSEFTVGIILIIAGLLFLAFNIGLFDGNYKRVIISWQMLLIVIGIVNLFQKHYSSGISLVVVGVFFIMPRLAMANPDVFYWIPRDFTNKYWGILLIIGGILVICQWTLQSKQKSRNDFYFVKDGEHYRSKKTSDGRHAFRSSFDRNSVFANVEEIVLEPEFTGGEMNAVFGGITLDLRRTSIPEGETGVELNAVFGGITIYVPENWHVELRMSHVFGGFQDKRLGTTENIDTSRKLVIYGSCIFGGGEIRN